MSYEHEPRSPFRGTTICAVKRDGAIAVAGDGQVTMGEHTIMKATARKVRRIYGGKVVVGFAGSVADAFALSEKFEDKLTQYSGNLPALRWSWPRTGAWTRPCASWRPCCCARTGTT